MHFLTTWLPNIVCTVSGIILSGLIGFWQGRRVARDSEKHTRMLTNLLIVMEERGQLKLVRDEKGEVTGGRAYELKAEAIAVSSSSAAADLTTGRPSPLFRHAAPDQNNAAVMQRPVACARGL